MLGIGITTYNRASTLSQTLELVLKHTLTPHCLVVVDDGSEDTTAEFLASSGVAYILGSHRGVAWNKNRALYYLKVIRQCDDIILLEDDTQPYEDGWEQLWIEAARRFHHVNLAPHTWPASTYLNGSGKPIDPFVSRLLTGQCASFRSEVLDLVGYLDSRFRGYGYEHAEHTQRIIESGYGGVMEWEDGEARHFPFLIQAPLRITCDNLTPQTEEIAKSAAIWGRFRHDQAWRAPWRSNAERAVFLAEMMSTRGHEILPSILEPLRDWILVTDRDLYLSFEAHSGQVIASKEASVNTVVVRSDGRLFDFILKTDNDNLLLAPSEDGALTFTPCPLDSPRKQLEVKRGNHESFELWYGAARIGYPDGPRSALTSTGRPDLLHTFLFFRYDTQKPSRKF